MGERKKESNTFLVRVQESYKFSRGCRKQLHGRRKGDFRERVRKPCKSEKACFAFGWYPKEKEIDISLHFTLFCANTKKTRSLAVLHGGSPISLSGEKKYIILLRTIVLFPNSY